MNVLTTSWGTFGPSSSPSFSAIWVSWMGRRSGSPPLLPCSRYLDHPVMRPQAYHDPHSPNRPDLSRRATQPPIPPDFGSWCRVGLLAPVQNSVSSQRRPVGIAQVIQHPRPSFGTVPVRHCSRSSWAVRYASWSLGRRWALQAYLWCRRLAIPRGERAVRAFLRVSPCSGFSNPWPSNRS